MYTRNYFILGNVLLYFSIASNASSSSNTKSQKTMTSNYVTTINLYYYFFFVWNKRNITAFATAPPPSSALGPRCTSRRGHRLMWKLALQYLLSAKGYRKYCTVYGKKQEKYILWKRRLASKRADLSAYFNNSAWQSSCCLHWKREFFHRAKAGRQPEGASLFLSSASHRSHHESEVYGHLFLQGRGQMPAGHTRRSKPALRVRWISAEISDRSGCCTDAGCGQRYDADCNHKYCWSIA